MSKGHVENMKSHVKVEKFIGKSNIHEGSQTVTREVKDHPMDYIHTLIVQAKDFSPWPPHKAIERQVGSFGEQVVAPTLHYWS